jgi:hypothetical protein
MPLTEQEQAECLRFLGYPNWQDLASSFQLGYPAPSDPEYLIRDAFVRINEQGIQLVRYDLENLRCIEAQISDLSRLKADQVGNLRMNKTEFSDLQRRLMYWTGKLQDDLGGYTNPFSHGPGTMSGRNSRVC